MTSTLAVRTIAPRADGAYPGLDLRSERLVAALAAIAAAPDLGGVLAAAMDGLLDLTGGVSCSVNLSSTTAC